MKLHCDIRLPASKSESNRALMIAAYGRFAPDFRNLSVSRDTTTLKNALKEISSIDSNRITSVRESYEFDGIEGNPQVIDIADCGTAARFLTTYLACHEGDWLLTGSERMKQRPMAPLVAALCIMDADIQYVENEGFLPLRIKGKPLKGGKVSIDMTQSSQFISSLLLAAPMFPQGLELELLGELNSLPYLDMTLTMMCHFSAQVERHGRTVVVKPQPYQKQPFTIDPDWSAASYWYEMAAFSEECEIKLRFPSLEVTMPIDELKGRFNLQGDSVVAEWMKSVGVCTTVFDDGLILTKMPFVKQPLSFDFANCPDLYPTMMATCTGLHIEAQFTSLNNLAIKESDRVEGMRLELSKLNNRPVRFCSHNDHRVVMALAPLALLCGPIAFDHPEVVEKSYPGFWKDVSFLPILR